MKSDPNKPPIEWTVRYWQWIYSKPRDQNPLKSGDINCEDFISLPCTGGGEDCGRAITLSGEDAEKDILIPVFASEYSNAEVVNGTDEQLREMARAMSVPVVMEASLDSIPLTPYYVESEPFTLEVPSNHSLENRIASAGRYRAVSCGYWHRLKPLAKGKHVIKFGGSARNGFYTKVSYEIDIK
jgi:hypothetical protein